MKRGVWFTGELGSWKAISVFHYWQVRLPLTEKLSFRIFADFLSFCCFRPKCHTRVRFTQRIFLLKMLELFSRLFYTNVFEMSFEF